MSDSDNKNLDSPSLEKGEKKIFPFHLEMINETKSKGHEVGVLDIFKALYKKKWFIISLTSFFIALSVFVTVLMPKKYTSVVTIMSLKGNKGGGFSMLTSQLGSMSLGGGLGGIAESLGGNKNKELVSILKSRTLSEQLIDRFNLLPIIFSDQWDGKSKTFHSKLIIFPPPVLEDGVNKFRKKFTKVLRNKKTGLIKISVTMKEPELAARVANGMVVALQDFINNNSLTVEKRNRIFIEEQMVKNKGRLLKAGMELNQFYSEKKISSVIPKVNVIVGSYEGQKQTFEEFRENLEQLQVDKESIPKDKETYILNGVPGQVYLQYLILNQELLAKIHTLLTQQYEFSKIEEAKEDLAFQVIDKAKVKIRSSSPKLFLNLSIGIFGGFFIAALIVLLKEISGKAKV